MMMNNDLQVCKLRTVPFKKKKKKKVRNWEPRKEKPVLHGGPQLWIVLADANLTIVALLDFKKQRRSSRLVVRR